jgi:hypothetical protein
MRTNQSAVYRPLGSLIVLGCVPPLARAHPPRLTASIDHDESHIHFIFGMVLRLLGRRYGLMLLAAFPERYRRNFGATRASPF